MAINPFPLNPPGKRLPKASLTSFLCGAFPDQTISAVTILAESPEHPKCSPVPALIIDSQTVFFENMSPLQNGEVFERRRYYFNHFCVCNTWHSA